MAKYCGVSTTCIHLQISLSHFFMSHDYIKIHLQQKNSFLFPSEFHLKWRSAAVPLSLYQHTWNHPLHTHKQSIHTGQSYSHNATPLVALCSPPDWNRFTFSFLAPFINSPSLLCCMCIVAQAADQQCMNMHPATAMREWWGWRADCTLLKQWDWIQLNRVNE